MNMARRRINGDTTVYSASAWWRDNDPSMQVVSLSERKAETELHKLMKEAARDARDSDLYNTITAALDDIRWSGVHAFALRDLASARELDEAIADLEARNVWYPPTY
jgi:hypothetical protein